MPHLRHPLLYAPLCPTVLLHLYAYDFVMDYLRLSMHCPIYKYIKPCSKARRTLSSFLLAPPVLLIVQSTDKPCISLLPCYTTPLLHT